MIGFLTVYFVLVAVVFTLSFLHDNPEPPWERLTTAATGSFAAMLPVLVLMALGIIVGLVFDY